MTDTPETAHGGQNEETGETLAAVLDKKNEQIPYEVVEEEKLEQSQVRFGLKITSEVLTPRVDEVLGEFKRQVAIPGFRKGKAPVKLIRNAYGKQAQDEAIRKMVPRLAELVAEEKEIEVLAQPGFEGWESTDDAGAVLKLVLEVRPAIEIKGETIEGIKVEVVDQPVTDERVQAELDRLREQNATYESVDGAEFTADDALSLSAEVTDGEGNRLANRCLDNEYIESVRGRFPEAVIEALAGKKSGDEVSVENIELDPDPQTGIRPLLNFKIQVHEIKKKVLPELDDEFAKDVSVDYETLDDLKAKIRDDLEENRNEQVRGQTLEGIYKTLRERVEFDVPPTLVQQLANNSIRQTESRFNQYGLSLKSMGQEYIQSYLSRVQDEAQTEARNLLLADQIGRFLEIEVSDDDLNAEIEKIAELQGRKPLAIRASLEKEKRMESFKADLRIKIVNDRLVEKANVKFVDKKEEDNPQEADAASEDSPE